METKSNNQMQRRGQEADASDATQGGGACAGQKAYLPPWGIVTLAERQRKLSCSAVERVVFDLQLDDGHGGP